MIHNITEERKKLHTQESAAFEPFNAFGTSNAFSDEELARMIHEVEGRALIHAPVHLKENVFSQIDAQRQRKKRRQLFSYRAKVLVGMAAALAVLFLVPADGERMADAPQAGILGSLLREDAAGGDTREDAWAEEAARRQEDIERSWERYREGQRRVYAAKRYLGSIAGIWNSDTNWEDE